MRTTGWVTHFVQDLKHELATLSRRELDVYFDQNPHDGVLPHHDVDDSIKERTNARVFVPILSRSYCTKGTFAWDHEFVPFVKKSAGLKVKLPSGNTASRILPIKIHDLPEEDVRLYETTAGITFRPIEFVYRAPGINRPLEPTDPPGSGPSYKDQINLAAHAILEICEAGSEQTERKSSSGKFIRAVVAGTLILLAGIAGWTYMNSGKSSDPRSTGIAILPFRNNTGDASMDYYGIGLASEIRTQLSQSRQFEFITALQATLGFANTTQTPSEIGDILQVDYLLTGIFQRSGSTIKIEAEFVSARDGKVIWALPYEGRPEDLLALQAEIASKVLAQFDKPSSTSQDGAKRNLDAYAHYIRGNQLLARTYTDSIQFESNFEPVIREFATAVALDSSFADAWADLIGVETFVYAGFPSEVSRLPRIRKYYAYVRNHIPDGWQRHLVEGHIAYRVDLDLPRALQEMLKVLEVNPENVHAVYVVSLIHKRNLNLSEALRYAAKQVSLDPAYGGHWSSLADILRLSGDIKGAYQACLKAWEVSRSKLTIQQILALGLDLDIPLEKIPAEIQATASTEFNASLAIRKGNWNPYIRMKIKQGELLHAAAACFASGNLDSAKMLASRSLAAGSEDSLQSYALMGERAKWKTLLEQKKKNDRRIDRLNQCLYAIEEVLHLAYLSDVQGATESLRKLNKEFPEFGDFQIFRGAWLDRFKKQHPEFAQALREVVEPPGLNKEAYRLF